jgi:hypothetical protein
VEGQVRLGQVKLSKREEAKIRSDDDDIEQYSSCWKFLPDNFIIQIQDESLVVSRENIVSTLILIVGLDSFMWIENFKIPLFLKPFHL